MSTDATVIDDATAADTAADTATDTTVADTTAADTSSADTTAADAAANDNWRATWAGEDKDLLKFLGRFHSPDAAIKKFKAINDDLKGGKYLTPLPENPTDDELKAYREQQGIPEAPAGYLDKLSDGLVVGDDDKPYVDKFLDKMHGSNAAPGVVNAALDAYYEIVEEQMSAEAEVANSAKNESIETLRSEWGGDYKRNLNAMHGFLDTLPAPVAEAFRSGKGADGVPIGYNADVLKWLTSLALEANPLATVVPGAGANQASAIADEIAKFQAKLGDRDSDYWKGPSAERNQARYRELLEAQEKLKGN